MIKELVHDPLFLGIKSKPAVKEDILVGRDLLDTLRAYSQTCVGMAANMIGVTKRIIAFSDNGKYTVMYNPQIVGKSGADQIVSQTQEKARPEPDFFNSMKPSHILRGQQKTESLLLRQYNHLYD